MRGTASLPKKVWLFYADGFRSMTVGRKLWLIIIIKLVIMFAIFRLLFFPNILQEKYENDEQRAAAVRSALTDNHRYHDIEK